MRGNCRGTTRDEANATLHDVVLHGRCLTETSKFPEFPVVGFILFRNFISVRQHVISNLPQFSCAAAADGVGFSTAMVHR